MTKTFRVTLLGVALAVTQFGCETGLKKFEIDNDPAYPGIFEPGQSSLTQLATPCTFASTIMTITIAGGETALVTKRASDSAVLVNGTQCGTATTSLTKKINVNGTSGSDETLILDYLNGALISGTAAAAAIVVDLGAGGADAVKIRGSSGIDTVYMGVNGIDMTKDGVRDISIAGVDSVVASLGAGNDAFSGTSVTGLGGSYAAAVTVYGGDGDDALTGGDGDDTLNGSAGNDTIAGGLGDDTLNGDAGNDTFTEGATTNGSDVFAGGLGTDTVSYALRTAAVTVTIGAGTTNDGEASEADDVQADIETLVGGTAGDTLTGSAADETISGGAGNDTIDGGDGVDTVNGDAGDDIFVEGSAANGADVINGGAGTDVVNYGSRTGDLTVTLDGTANDGEAMEGDNVKTDVENVYGGGGDDSITGSSSANLLRGGAGDDTLNGGAGDDTFDEGAAASGADTINGGAGDDTVDYSARSAALTITMGDTTANDGASMEADNIGSDVENVLLGSGANTVTGNTLDNRIVGNAGIDTIDGDAGADTIEGLGAADVLNGGAGDDIIEGGAGNDTIDCGAGEGDIRLGAVGTDTVTNCEL